MIERQPDHFIHAISKPRSKINKDGMLDFWYTAIPSIISFGGNYFNPNISRKTVEYIKYKKALSDHTKK